MTGPVLSVRKIVAWVPEPVDAPPSPWLRVLAWLDEQMPMTSAWIDTVQPPDTISDKRLLDEINPDAFVMREPGPEPIGWPAVLAFYAEQAEREFYGLETWPGDL